MRSSYEQNNLGSTFTEMVTSNKPKIVVELGILHGYSLLHLALGLKSNGFGKLFAYDLFEDYEYNHGTQKEIKKLIMDYKLDNFVSIDKIDAYEVHKRFNDGSVDLLHIDISNDGNVLNTMVFNWHTKIPVGGSILFEGGSEERDNVDWMVKYNKKPIRPELFRNPFILDFYTVRVIEKFPSLSIITKRGNNNGYKS